MCSTNQQSTPTCSKELTEGMPHKAAGKICRASHHASAKAASGPPDRSWGCTEHTALGMHTAHSTDRRCSAPGRTQSARRVPCRASCACSAHRVPCTIVHQDARKVHIVCHAVHIVCHAVHIVCHAVHIVCHAVHAVCHAVHIVCHAVHAVCHAVHAVCHAVHAVCHAVHIVCHAVHIVCHAVHIVCHAVHIVCHAGHRAAPRMLTCRCLSLPLCTL